MLRPYGHLISATGECIKNLKPRKFEWETLEGSEDVSDRQENLLHYVEQHILVVDRYWNRICLNESVMKRSNKANRSGGDRQRTWCELNDAIAKGLSRREKEVLSSAQAIDTCRAQAPSIHYPS